jgi:hypothetical protein
MIWLLPTATVPVHRQPETQMEVVETVIRWQGRYICTATSNIALPWWSEHEMNKRTQPN